MCVLDLFLAGTETTSTTLCWGLIYLIINPDVQGEHTIHTQTTIGTYVVCNINVSDIWICAGVICREGPGRDRQSDWTVTGAKFSRQSQHALHWSCYPRDPKIRRYCTTKCLACGRQRHNPWKVLYSKGEWYDSFIPVLQSHLTVTDTLSVPSLFES